MNLTLAIHTIAEIRFDKNIELSGSKLSVDCDELRRLVLEDDSFEGVNFELIQPGESCRAGPVFDIVEPRAKAVGGNGSGSGDGV